MEEDRGQSLQPPLAQALEVVRIFHQMCREGRLYNIERWINEGKPLQIAPEGIRKGTRPKTALQLFHGFSTDFGQWRTVGSLTPGTPRHVIVSYDNSDTANVPTVYFDLVSQTVNTEQTPVGIASSDAASNLLLGGHAAGTDEMDGVLQHCVIDETIWTGAQRNRHYHYGIIGGGVEVQHPMVTDKLGNEGSAIAVLGSSNGIRPIPRVGRRWGSIMGVGH